MAYTERYVTNAGAGAHNGDSEANAWTWAEMLTNMAAGERANIKGSVTASGTSAWTNSASGSAASPFGIRGYNSTIGDLANPTRTNGSGALVTTNFPVITSGGTITLPAFHDVSNIFIDQTAGISYAAEAANYYGTIYDAVIRNSSTNGEVYRSSATYSTCTNCDLIQASTNTSAKSIRLNSGHLQFCRLTNPGGATEAAVSFSGPHSMVACCQILDFLIGFDVNSLNLGSILHNSARGCNTFITNSDTTAMLIVANNLAWGTNAAGSEFYKGVASDPIFLQKNAYGNFADANQQLGNWPELQSIALTADPFTSSSDLRLNGTAGGGAGCKKTGLFANDLGAISAASAGFIGLIMGTWL